jgi:hypothetical protein
MHNPTNNDKQSSGQSIATKKFPANFYKTKAMMIPDPKL